MLFHSEFSIVILPKDHRLDWFFNDLNPIKTYSFYERREKTVKNYQEILFDISTIPLKGNNEEQQIVIYDTEFISDIKNFLVELSKFKYHFIFITERQFGDDTTLCLCDNYLLTKCKNFFDLEFESIYNHDKRNHISISVCNLPFHLVIIELLSGGKQILTRNEIRSLIKKIKKDDKQENY